MHNEPSVSVSRDRHFGGPKKSVTIYRNRRSHLTEMTGHALPKSAVTIGRNTQFTDPDGRAGILVAPIVVAAVIVGGGYYVLTHMPARTGSSQSDGLSGLLGSSDTLPFYTPVLNEATEPEGQDGGAAEGGSKTAAGGAATPPPEDENRRREKTDHGQERADQAKYDSSRSVGDSNRVVRDGQRFIDNDTGNTVHVNGNRVVVTNERGDVVTQFRNSRANTISRVESGRWTRVD